MCRCVQVGLPPSFYTHLVIRLMIMFCRDEVNKFTELYMLTINGVFVHVLKTSVMEKEINHKQNGKSFIVKRQFYSNTLHLYILYLYMIIFTFSHD